MELQQQQQQLLMVESALLDLDQGGEVEPSQVSFQSSDHIRSRRMLRWLCMDVAAVSSRSLHTPKPLTPRPAPTSTPASASPSTPSPPPWPAPARAAVRPCRRTRVSILKSPDPINPETHTTPPGSEAEPWVCLSCGATRCSRYVNACAGESERGCVSSYRVGIEPVNLLNRIDPTWNRAYQNLTRSAHTQTHAKQNQKQKLEAHFFESMAEEQHHALVLSLSDLSVWCYACACYVKHDRLLPLLVRAEATCVQTYVYVWTCVVDGIGRIDRSISISMI